MKPEIMRRIENLTTIYQKEKVTLSDFIPIQ